MNSTIRNVLAALLFVVAACSEKAGSKTDQEAIRTCFKEYQEALASNDGKTVAHLVSKNTLTYFSGILDNALNADEAKVRKLDFYPKMMVLLVRQDLYDIYMTNGYITNAFEFFALIVERGWVGQVGAENLELGNIGMNTDRRASAPGILNGQPTPAMFCFERAAEGWKFSLLDVILRVNELMAEKQKNASVSEDDAILLSLEARTGRPIRKDIWKPMRKS